MEPREVIPDVLERAQDRYTEMVERGDHRTNLEEKDVVTEIDRQMTELFRQFFDRLEPRFRIASEESSKKDNSTDVEDADFTVILDEIDATHHLREQRGPHGPIVAIAEGQSPEFKDVIGAGYLNLEKRTLYEAYRNEGAFRTENFPSGKRENIQTTKQEKMVPGSGTALLIDQGMLGEAPELAAGAWSYWCNDYGSQGEQYAMIAEGSRDAFITGGFSKLEAKPVNSAEELAAMYLIVEEAGGAVRDWSGSDISGEKVGMSQKKNHDVIAASTENLAQKISKRIIPDEYT